MWYFTTASQAGLRQRAIELVKYLFITSLKGHSPLPIPCSLDRAGRWFLRSGIQEASGGVARYYRADLGCNLAVSTEITGYAASTFAFLHRTTGDPEYLNRAATAARFLTAHSWNDELQTFPFEHGVPGEPLAYFFDSGIIIRGLLAVWREMRNPQLLALARGCGIAMAQDFHARDSEFHPILRLPAKEPLPRDDRWSRAPGCYQLKSAMAWYELFEATGEREFELYYDRVLDFALRTYAAFLPGHPDRNRVMDRLHAYSYFLEGMLPRVSQKSCGAALCDGIRRVGEYLREIGPEFERSDVYAQLLRIRVYADWAGVVPLDREAASWEAERLGGFQADDRGERIFGGFYFGRKGGDLLPHVNPVSAAFALQALAAWERWQAGAEPLDWRELI